MAKHPRTTDNVTSRLEAEAEQVFARQASLLRNMAACRTVSGTSPGPDFRREAEACLDVVEAELADMGFERERWDAGGRFPTLAARRSTAGARSAIGFNGHIDVVPIEDPAKWSQDPWRGDQVGSRMYGRGTCDAKASVAAMIGAIRLLDAAGVSARCHLLLHVVSDEEVAGPCTDECLDRGAPDAVIVGEPSSLDVWIAEPGLEHVRIEIDGLATHALNRWRALPIGGASERGGVNAIEKALLIVEAIRGVEHERTERHRYPLLPTGFNTANLGVIIGGKSGGPGQANVEAGPGSVPDFCALEYNIWYYPNERLADVRTEIETRVVEACADDPWLRAHRPRFTWALRGLSNPPAETDPAHPLAEALLVAARRQKPRAKATAMQGASLLPWYTRRGIPGVIFGPGDVEQAHGADEFVDLGCLRAATLVLATALADERLKEVMPAVQ